MKILSGDARGRNLRTPPKSAVHVRPILARIKKSLFDIIRPRTAGSRFLDIYAGVGAVGIEALSRGAASSAFIEQDPMCARLIQENLDLLKLSDKGTIYRMNAMGNLSALARPFDLIFLGPPYKDAAKQMLALTVPTLLNLETHKLVAPGALVIAQHHKTEPVQEPSDQWKMTRREKYGDTFLSFFALR